MAAKKEKKMSREEALQLYQDLQSSVSAIMRGKAPPKVAKPGAPVSTMKTLSQIKEDLQPEGSNAPQRDRGAIAAVTFVLFCGMVKLGVSVIDYLGIFDAQIAQASMIQTSPMHKQIAANLDTGITQDDVKILTSLDARRTELEEKGKMLDGREEDINKRDKEYVTKLTELRELTEKLKLERDKDEKKKGNELDQLANVYGSMAPQEAAQLIEQLDVTIALPLLKRLPEKRMGQILPLMSPERALAITKLLSGATS